MLGWSSNGTGRIGQQGVFIAGKSSLAYHMLRCTVASKMLTSLVALTNTGDTVET